MELILVNPKLPEKVIFIEIDRAGPQTLLFKIEQVRFDDTSEENITEHKESIGASRFSAWWQRKMSLGWEMKGSL